MRDGVRISWASGGQPGQSVCLPRPSHNKKEGERSYVESFGGGLGLESFGGGLRVDVMVAMS